MYRPATGLYVPVRPTQWPIVYRPEYNIGFLGLEKLHPFDAGKWGRVFEFLKGMQWWNMYYEIRSSILFVGQSTNLGSHQNSCSFHKHIHHCQSTQFRAREIKWFHSICSYVQMMIYILCLLVQILSLKTLLKSYSNLRLSCKCSDTEILHRNHMTHNYLFYYLYIKMLLCVFSINSAFL